MTRGVEGDIEMFVFKTVEAVVVGTRRSMVAAAVAAVAAVVLVVVLLVGRCGMSL